MVATGTVAGSGAGRLVVRIDPLAARDDAEIELGLRDQDLHAFESYTVPAEGMHLRGTIVESAAAFHLDDARAVHGAVSGSFRDLELNFTPFPRSRIEAAALNLGVAVQVARTNANLPLARRSTTLEVARAPHEPVMGFLWRSVSGSAVVLANNGGSPR
jgi:hypothetical protein